MSNGIGTHGWPYCCWRKLPDREWIAIIEINGAPVQYVKRKFDKTTNDKATLGNRIRCFIPKDSIIKFWFMPVAHPDDSTNCGKPRPYNIEVGGTTAVIERVRQFE